MFNQQFTGRGFAVASVPKQNDGDNLIWAAFKHVQRVDESRVAPVYLAEVVQHTSLS